MPTAGDPILIETMPGSEVGRTTRVTAVGTFTTTETQLDSITVPVIESATYKVHWRPQISSSVADGRVTMRIRENNTSGTVVYSDAIHTANQIAGQGKSYTFEGFYTATATGNKTFVATGQRAAGTGDINSYADSGVPTWFYVEFISD